MTFSRALGLIASAFLVSLASGEIRAQTTDGYHMIQVFPVVVDTASFAQQFHFRNPNAVPLSVTATFFPAIGTTAVGGGCGSFNIPAGGVTTFSSLRSICTQLPAGSQFGFLYTSGSNTDIASYAGFSRIANPQGNGFAVEAFSANVFTSATLVVNGVRRSAATASAPAFQTNCFVGNLNTLDPLPPSEGGVTPRADIHYSIYSSANVLIAAADLSLLPGEIVRLLDVFAIAPAGNYVNAYVKFERQGSRTPGIMAFCTVQDNTSFGADFRVAKQEVSTGLNVGKLTVGSMDVLAAREVYRGGDYVGSYSLGGSGTYNEHVLYLRNPDWLQCELLDSLGLPWASRLEMRLSSLSAGGGVGAGGNNVRSFGKIYLGDKAASDGLNGRYVVRVEDDGGMGVASYQLHCVSGSGSTLGDLIKYQAAGDAF